MTVTREQLDAAELPFATLPTTREVVRLITYHGDADLMAIQLGRSLPDGLRKGKVDITVRTLDDSAGLLIGTADPLAALLQRLGEVESWGNSVALALRDAGNELVQLRRERNEVGLLDRVRELVAGDFSVDALRDLLGPGK